MKVAVVTSFPRDPGRPRGGVEAVSVHLVRALAELGDLDVHAITCRPDVARAATHTWEGATIHELPRGGGSTLANALGEGRRIVQHYLAELKPTVVHAHDTYGLMIQGLPFPRAFTVHGFIHADTEVSDSRLAWLRGRIWKWYETRGWADQPHIISISPYVRERLHGIATGVIHDIDNPIGPEFFRIERAEQPGTVFCAGLICRRKNTLALVEALDRVVKSGIDGRLRLAGPVSEPDYGALLERRTRELGLADRVEMLGSIPTAAVHGELARASVFALVSLEEGSPMGIEEAMAARVPVLTSNRCGMPYMVRDGESGFLVNPLDADDIAWRMGELLSDVSLRARLGAMARHVAEDRFHPAVVARQTREVYRRALRDAEKENGRVAL